MIDPNGQYAWFGTYTSPGGRSGSPVGLHASSRYHLSGGEDHIGHGSAVIDPTGQYAYFGTSTFDGWVVKVRLSPFSRVGAITAGHFTNVAVLDPTGQYAYFGTTSAPGSVAKIRLSDFPRGDLAFPGRR